MTEEKRKKPKSKNNDVYLNVLKKIDLDVGSKIREIEMQDESQDQQGGTLRPGLLQSSWRNNKEDDNDNFLSLGDLLNEAEKERISTDNIKQHLVYLSRQEVKKQRLKALKKSRWLRSYFFVLIFFLTFLLKFL